MKPATLKQAGKVLKLVEETEIPLEQLQKLLASGLLSDLLNANMDEINRDEFRKLCGLFPISTEFPIWKTIKLGTGLKSTDDSRKSIKKNGMKISDWASDILGKPTFTTAAQETELDLVKVTVAELGFKKGARREQIYIRAKELGLELCPSEVGPQLRLQYQDQPNGEWLLIAMEPITGSDGGLGVFSVERGGSGLWLRSDYGGPGNFWHPDAQWVFVRPRE